ncbi:helix-turn-helix transcriptional regulator [Caulobacter sp. BK020]|uniref:helix-turn-helix domain-containing protein n=1 Tax=Caulobacter sp. BK020 TaxID=2512117 RepID=UPI0010470DF4|nr:helix-turn-helix transcriptional regulator [Caulobacter sp. BK020]TCS07546.1 helix-turn-helix protein [Caulobacter sp. BK020]
MEQRSDNPPRGGRDERARVGWNLRRLRVTRGLTQERLAQEAGVDRTYVSGLERGRENPTVDLLDRLALVLGAPLGAFFVEPPDRAAPPPVLRAGRKRRRPPDDGLAEPAGRPFLVEGRRGVVAWGALAG